MPSLRTISFLNIMFAVVSHQVQAQFVEHPSFTNWSKFPVGTSVTIKTRNTGKSMKVIETIAVSTLLQKTEKSVVVSLVISSNATGQWIKNDPIESTVKRDFPLLPGVDKTRIGRPQGITQSGNEMLQILSKTYQAEWYISKGNTEAGPSITKTWISPDFPGQVLKSITEVPAGPNTSVDEVVEMKLGNVR